MAYPISIENFEGPLDLLLHLLAVHKIDIYDIPIASITKQYLDYIYQWEEMNLEIAGEFIVMAARLLEIKSYGLLPILSEASENDEDPKQALIDQLLAYQVFKRIGIYLKNQEEKYLGQIFKEPAYYPESEQFEPICIDGEMLSEAFSKVLAMERESLSPTSIINRIEREQYKVEDKISLIENLLAARKDTPVSFSELVTEKGGKQEVIVTFQALLELYKKGGVVFKQAGLFQEIMVYRIV